MEYEMKRIIFLLVVAEMVIVNASITDEHAWDVNNNKPWSVRFDTTIYVGSHYKQCLIATRADANYGGEIFIPSVVTSGGGNTGASVKYYDITGIRVGGLANQYYITDVNIPNCIVSIGERAFARCTSLTNITFSSGVSDIGKWAFTNCTKLTNLVIPSNVTTIGNGAFLGCVKLDDVCFMGDAPIGLVDSCILDYATNVRYRKKYSAAYSNIVSKRQFGGHLLFDDDEFLDVIGQTFLHGNSAWFGDHDVSHDGEGAMRSGAVGSNGESWIETTVNGPVRVSFWWKASSEEYDGEVFDYAYMSLDGEPQGALTDAYQLEGVAIGGKTDWTNVVVDVTEPGEHTVRWTYRKDEVDESDVGEDCVWLDEVSLDPLATLTFSIGDGAGTAPAPINAFTRTRVSLPWRSGFDKANHTFVGWNDGTDTYPAGARYLVTATNISFSAVWRANTLTAPVISSADVADGGVLDAESATIAMSAEKGATIHYTLDGSAPTAASAVYMGPFAVDALSVNVRAVAVRNNYFYSPVAGFAFTRKPSGAAECLNAEWRNISTDGTSPWTEVTGGAAHDGVSALRSGAVGDEESSSVEMTVVGSGVISFWWKTSSEISRNRKYDYVSFLVDGEERSWLGGVTGWTNETFAVAGDGTHTFRWVYQKNDNGLTQGEDCAWLDEVTWTSSDPLPEITGAGEIKAVFAKAGDEVRLKANISTEATYNAFRDWVDGKELEHASVKDSPNAWLAYVLDSVGLMAKTAALVSEDVVIESLAPSSATAGAFDLVVCIGGAEIGTGARLTEALGVEGATNLTESAFSTEGFSAALERTADGKVKATVTPDGSPPSFFLRVMVK